MKNVPITKLQRWHHNAVKLAEQAEALRKDLSRECQGRENSMLLTVYSGEAKAASVELSNELARLIALKTADEREQLAEKAGAL